MMYKSKGLLSMVKALSILLLVVALPTAVVAQNAQMARVAVNSSDTGFDDLLLVQNGDTVSVIGLTDSLPSQSVVTVSAGTQVASTTASVFGQFPIVDGDSISFDVSALSELVATVTAVQPSGAAISGTFTLDVDGDIVVQALEAKTTPANALLDMTAVDSANQSLLGQVLLSQKLQAQGGVNSVVDEFEGIPGSIPPFSQVEVYRGAFDGSVNPPASRLIRITRNENILTDENGDTIVDSNGDPVLVSNGSFFPFVTGDINSANSDVFTPVVSLRITSTQSPAAFEPFWAQITNDVTVSISDVSVTQTTNGENFATVNATVDPYALVTVYAQNDPTGPVLASERADASGSVSILVPPAFVDGFPVMQENVYLLVQDPFGNQNADLEEVNIDDGTVIPTIDSVSSVFPGGFLVQGSAESRARIRIWAVAEGFEFPEPLPETLPLGGLPEEAFFFTGLTTGADGSFSILLPPAISRVVAINALDSYGNESDYRIIDLNNIDPGTVPDFGGPWTLQIDNVVNNLPGGFAGSDLVEGALLEADGTATDGVADFVIDGSTVSAQVVVSAYLRADADPEAPFPFINELTTDSTVGSGNYSLNVPDFDPIAGEFVEEFFIVALAVLPDQSVVVLSFLSIDEADGIDRTGPRITFAPLADDVELLELGKGSADTMNIRRIYVNDLPADALPLIVVLADGNDDFSIDINSSDLSIVDVKPMNQVMFNGMLGGMMAPIPGANGLNLGQNYWDAPSQSVVGRSVVFVSLIDANGNYSPNPIAVELDVETADPNLSVVTASGTVVQGATDAVEAGSYVTVYENADKTGVIGTTQANQVGAFYIGGLSIMNSNVYIAVRDQAGNESNAVKVRVLNPVMAPQFVILDGFGLLHSPDGVVSSNIASSDSVRAMAGVENAAGTTLAGDSPLYVLNSDGAIAKIGFSGAQPVETLSIPGGFARDIEVVSPNPFAGYVLLGNGVVVPFGDAPFLGDMVTRDPQGADRLRLPGSQVMFDDLNGNGEFDSEDANGNGVLDTIAIPTPPFVLTEDTNGNGELDEEPTIDPANLGQGFFIDIARDLELVINADGSVAGYVIMDGNGVLWTFGSGYGEDVINDVGETNGFSTDDIFRSLELVLDASGDETQIVDFITMNGFGQVYGAPGGLLGAGASDDADNRGNLSGRLNAPSFNFDIARDIRISSEDSNGDGSIDYMDGFYILDGYGGVHAIGGATPISDSPFLGHDIARDLDFITQALR